MSASTPWTTSDTDAAHPDREPVMSQPSPVVAYLVIWPHDYAVHGYAPEDRDRAHDIARATGGLVLSLPVDADYRARGGFGHGL